MHPQIKGETMSFIQKNNTGTLFLNERKTETKHPDYTGKAIINNKLMWVSAWIKVGKSGKKFISISVQEPFTKSKPQQVSVNDFESTQETFDEGNGEPDFNQQVDEFVKGQKTNEEDDEPLPF